jgi:hypothetical protein
MLDLKRRQFLTLLGGAAAAWPLAARAQQADRMRRLGVLKSADAGDAFTEELAVLGWADGPNLRMEIRWAATSIGHRFCQRVGRPTAGCDPCARNPDDCCAQTGDADNLDCICHGSSQTAR